jgi:hypothetical protein
LPFDIYSQSKVIAMEEVKEKLLQFLLDRSQMVLSSLGCPIEKVCTVLPCSEWVMVTVLGNVRREWSLVI